MTLERAEEILKGVVAKPEPKVLGKDPKSKQDIVLANGRYGLYLKCGKNNYAIPRSLDAKNLSFEDAVKIIAAKK